MIIHEHSRYPVVEIVRSVSANTVIPVVDKVLSIFGRPDVIKTDNGSPLNSVAFQRYAENSGFKHRRITPLWPRANAQAEAFNKPTMKAVRTAIVEWKNWQQELHRFLRQYKASPHPSTKYSPYRLMFGREPRTTLPQQKDGHVKTQTEVKAAQKYARAKSRMKHYADQRNRAATKDIKVGDTVLLRRDTKRDKTTAPFHVHQSVRSDQQKRKHGHVPSRREKGKKKFDVVSEDYNERQHQESYNDDDDDDFTVHPNDRVEPVRDELAQRPRRNIRRTRRFRDYVT